MSDSEMSPASKTSDVHRLVRRLREESAIHQTVFADDRRRKALLAEAADTIEHLLNEEK